MKSSARHSSVTVKLNSQVEGQDRKSSYWGDFNYNSNDKIVLYGKGNDHPYQIADLSERSLLHSRIVKVATDLIAGEIGFKVKGKEIQDVSTADEKRIEEVHQMYKAWNIEATHKMRCYHLYNWGYSPELLNFQVSAIADEPKSLIVAARPSTEFRLGVHENTFFGLRPKYHFYSYYWYLCKDATLGGQIIKTPRQFFAAKKLSERHVMRVPVLEDGKKIPDTRMGIFSYLIGMPKLTNQYYPKPFWESGVSWQKIAAEYELGFVNRNTIKRGLRTDYIVNVYRAVYNNPAGDNIVGEQKSSDQQEIERNLLGFGNAGTVKINFIGLKDGNLEDKRVSDGHMEFVPVPTANNYKELQERKKDITEDILKAHAFGISPMAGVQLEKTAFSNMAEYLLYLSEIYVNCVIKPHANEVDRFYNEVVNLNMGIEDLETFTKIQLPVMRALIQQFKEVLTQNEIRADVFNKEPLTDSDRREIDDTDENEIAEELAKKIGDERFL